VVVSLFSLVDGYRHFGRIYCLSLRGIKFVTTKFLHADVGSSETSVSIWYDIEQCHSSEDHSSDVTDMRYEVCNSRHWVCDNEETVDVMTQ
jgi:hypothetical protein